MKHHILLSLLLLLLPLHSSHAQSTIMIVGDSISNGYQIPAGKSWGSLLQQCINNMHADILVVNDLYADLKQGADSLQKDGLHATPKSQQQIMNTVWKIIPKLPGNA